MLIRATEKGNKNSVGNQHSMPQQNDKRQKIKIESIESADSIQLKLITTFRNCCNKAGENDCCLLQYFPTKDIQCTKINSTDWDPCLKFVQDCQSKIRFKNPDEKKDFLEEIFKESMQPPYTGSESKQKNNFILKMDYVLPGKRKVCRKIFCYVYGYTQYSLGECSKAIRAGIKFRLFNVKKFTEEHIHEYNHRESANILKDNVKVIGTINDV
jgi:hypothetical protein